MSVSWCAALPESHLLDEFAGDVRGDALLNVDGDGDDGVRILLRHILDVHPALARTDQHRALKREVQALRAKEKRGFRLACFLCCGHSVICAAAISQSRSSLTPPPVGEN